MSSSVSTDPFHALVAALRAGGHTDHSARLNNALNGTWTTSSELLCELGVVVIDIRRECRPLNANQKALVRECMRQVRKAFPGFGLLSWLPFRRRNNVK